MPMASSTQNTSSIAKPSEKLVISKTSSKVEYYKKLALASKENGNEAGYQYHLKTVEQLCEKEKGKFSLTLLLTKLCCLYSKLNKCSVLLRDDAFQR